MSAEAATCRRPARAGQRPSCRGRDAGLRRPPPLDHDHPRHDHRRAACCRSSCLSRRSAGSAARTSGSTASPTPASSCCWRSASTSSSAWRACSTSATRRSSRSASYDVRVRPASPFTGSNFPFWPMLLVGAVVAAVFGILLGAPTLRLRGDYLAIVTLGFGEIVPHRLPQLVDKCTNGTERDRRASTARRCRGFGFPATGNPWPYYVTMAVLITIVDDPDLPAPGFATRPGVEGDPRGRARRGRATASTPSRPSCSRSRSGHRPPASPASSAPPSSSSSARPVPVQRVVHGAGDGRPRRHGQHLGRRRRAPSSST